MKKANRLQMKRERKMRSDYNGKIDINKEAHSTEIESNKQAHKTEIESIKQDNIDLKNRVIVLEKCEYYTKNEKIGATFIVIAGTTLGSVFITYYDGVIIRPYSRIQPQIIG